jgi:hypothetical protein
MYVVIMSKKIVILIGTLYKGHTIKHKQISMQTKKLVKALLLHSILKIYKATTIGYQRTTSIPIYLCLDT